MSQRRIALVGAGSMGRNHARVIAENLDAELQEVWDHLRLPGAPDLPRAKGNARPAGHYRELYTPTSKQRVADVFADTIEAFGYEF